MEALGCFAVVFALLGPAAFVIALVCLNKINQLEQRIRQGYLKEYMSRSGTGEPEAARPSYVEIKPEPVVIKPEPAVVETVSPPAADEPLEIPSEPHESVFPEIAQPDFEEVQDNTAVPGKYSTMMGSVNKYDEEPVAKPRASQVSLEQTIGTRWILIAGIILVIFAVCFFLKYAYDNMWVGPWARVGIVAAGGLLALIVGEVTRRRGYEIVAKGTAALGFAMLYAAVFSAYHWYHLIDTTPAFAGAILVTAAAMAYAVTLDEILITFLSLVGGFLTPMIVQTGKNLPHHLFGYVLILSCGVMVCAMFRRWRAVNVMAFIGTFLLYTLWFEKFVRDALPYVQSQENVIRVAECWLGVFFAVYLVLPLLYGFVKKAAANKEDIFLPTTAGMITFYYLWTMLEEFFRTELAVWTAVMGVVYLVTAGVAMMRCREDKDLRTALGVVGVAFITAALPLYFETYALVIGWTIKAVILLAVGIIYGSMIGQTLGFIVTALSILGLFWVPGQGDKFTPVFNGIFGTWMFTAAGAFVSHLFYRRKKETEGYCILSEVLFLIAGAVTLVACYFEWQAYCTVAFAGQGTVFAKGMLCILTVFGILFTAVGLFYTSVMIRGAGILALGASVVGLLGIFSHTGIYHPILNTIFGTWMAVGAGVGVGHLLYRFWKGPRGFDYDFWTQGLFIVCAAVLLSGCCLEWHRFWSHQEMAEAVLNSLTWRGILCAMSVFMLAQIIRPLSPGGDLCLTAGIIAGAAAGLLAFGFVETLYYRDFRFVLNTIFGVQAVPVAAIFIAAIYLKRERQNYDIDPKWYQGLALFGVVLLWALLSQQVYWYWSCRNEYGTGIVDWRFKMNMCLSLLWAGYAAILLIVGFWKHLPVIRYMALGLFGLLLGKVFIVDMSTVKSVYRITAFLATGLTLVGVSYVYQYLKKQGFFEKLMAGEQNKKEL
jgi:uncharacterized membrane protein